MAVIGAKCSDRFSISRTGRALVNWAHCPSTKDLRQVIDAWEKCNEYNSNHYVDGEMIIEDEGGPKVWSDLSCEPYSDAKLSSDVAISG